ncbi:thiamine-phosphate kinase [Glaciihabitans tibetensis]|uniref:Thiamine-monophosphate kinase n=1 Tax=Glaciihabitans tibetensis TaxID=1266600 RepID=A0A2T0VI17_9MICO|nr:thiamine-phosphate kinase [Glaciihabitans tibetensis]PRY69880.1 thiamine-phosphate kinase [Glaciihabitans tibetensis]
MTTADTLDGIGESATLARIFPRLPASSLQLLGPGDDCAVVAAPDGRFVVTTDMMIHGPDFRLAWSSPHDLGWKAAASNLADVAAMGAVPTALVVAIAAPATSPVSLLEGISDGLRDGLAALAPGCGVVGGDLSVSNTLTITVTAFGDLEGRAPVRRSGARIGDVIAVAGVLGMAAAGLRLLFADAVVGGEPDATAAAILRARHPALISAQLAPTPPIFAGRIAALAGATAMLDLSDGLALDARRMARASGVSINLDSGAVGSRAALDGGEDHSLLAAFGAEAPLPAEFRRIGVVQAADPGHGPGVLVDGQPYDALGGWDPYAGWNGETG